MKLRLLLNEDCNRSCKGCCNKNFDLSTLPVCRSFLDYKQIMITGGEPMLRVARLASVIWKIRKQTNAPIYLYTAYRENPRLLAAIVKTVIDGLTLTLHSNKDVAAFVELDSLLSQVIGISKKSLRLNVFKGVSLGDYKPSCAWQIKRNIRWIKNCPLPTDEVFMRYEPGELS